MADLHVPASEPAIHNPWHTHAFHRFAVNALFTQQRFHTRGMTQFQVDSDLVHAANSAIQNSIQQINSEIHSLQSQLVSLNDSWRGVAANEFQSLAVRWGATASAVQRQLAELGTALTLAASQYEEIEAANVRLFT